jgi:hypothetical protein
MFQIRGLLSLKDPKILPSSWFSREVDLLVGSGSVKEVVSKYFNENRGVTSCFVNYRRVTDEEYKSAHSQCNRLLLKQKTFERSLNRFLSTNLGEAEDKRCQLLEA